MSAAPKRRYESPRQLERQRHILATTRALLEQQGYAGVTIRGLARAAGVAQGTLYNLYSSKDELILAAVDDLLSEIGEQALERRVSNGVESILTLSDITARQIQATPNYADAITRTLFRAQPDDPIVEVLFARSLPYVLSALEHSAARGELQPGVDPELLARHLVGQGWSVVLQWLMGLLKLEDLARERRRSDLMTLVGITRGRLRTRLQAQLEAL